MHATRRMLLRSATALAVALLSGCTSYTNIEHTGGHYYELTRVHQSWEPSSGMTALKYRDSDTKYLRGSWTTVWPYIGGNVYVTNELAVFIAEVGTKTPRPHEWRSTESRVFAVEGKSIPVDITDQVFHRGMPNVSKDNRGRSNAKIAFIVRKDERIKFGYATSGPDVNVELSWPEIVDVMNSAKAKGVVRKDRVWRQSYIAPPAESR